jgi:hypothetical protein
MWKLIACETLVREGNAPTDGLGATMRIWWTGWETTQQVCFHCLRRNCKRLSVHEWEDNIEEF